MGIYQASGGEGFYLSFSYIISTSWIFRREDTRYQPKLGALIDLLERFCYRI